MGEEKKKNLQSPKEDSVKKRYSDSSRSVITEFKTTGTGPGNKHSSHKK